MGSGRKHPLANCETCEWNTLGKYVPDKGPEGASILVIGEAPSGLEIDRREIFTAPAGQLVTKVIKNYIGDDVKFTNAVACHPPYAPGVKYANPSKNVIECCKPRVLAQINEHTKKVLVLGNTAKESVIGTKEKITSYRKGQPKELMINGHHVLVAPTFHPSACLISSDNFPSLVADVKKLNTGKVEWIEPKVWTYAPSWVVPEDKVIQKHFPYSPGVQFDWLSIDDCLTFLSSLVDSSETDIIAVDIETNSDKDKSFTHPKEWLSIAIAISDMEVHVIGGAYLNDQRVIDYLRLILTRHETVYHNAKFDVQVLMRLGIIDSPRFTHDTMLGHYVLDERTGYHDLKGLSSELLGISDYDANIKPYTRGKYGSFGRIPKPLLYEYNAYDAACTLRLWRIFCPRVISNRTYNRLIDHSKELIHIESGGIHLDMDHLDKIDEHIAGEIARVENQLLSWVENPSSNQQVLKSLKRLGVKSALDTRAATLERALRDLDRTHSAYRFISLILEHRKLKKLHSTYIVGIRRKAIDGKVFPTYLQHGTVFGRLSSRNPNIQNIPRGEIIRKLFIPNSGNVLIQCDYSQVELRVIACEAKDEYLQGIFWNPDRDIHGEVSDRLYGKGNWNKEDRVRAKVYVFGSIYGLEPYSIALAHNISEDQAAFEQQEFFSLIPDVMRWRDNVISEVYKKQYLTNHFGRVRRFHLLTKQNKKSVGKEALAFIPQSTANDICLEAMLRVRRTFGTDGPQIRNLVHDSIMVECKEENKLEVGETVIDIMRTTAKEVYSDYVPFNADAEYGYSWGELIES